MKTLTTKQIVAKVAEIKVAHYTTAQTKRIHNSLKRDSVAKLERAREAVREARSSK